VAEAAGEVDVVQGAGDLAVGVGGRLAVLEGDDLGERLAIALEQLAEAEHHLGASGQGAAAPLRERRHCGRDSRIDLGRARQLDLGLRLAGRGVPNRCGASRGAGRVLPVDPVADAFQR
jgi:hypothetical protein